MWIINQLILVGGLKKTLWKIWVRQLGWNSMKFKKSYKNSWSKPTTRKYGVALFDKANGSTAIPTTNGFGKAMAIQSTNGILLMDWKTNVNSIGWYSILDPPKLCDIDGMSITAWCLKNRNGFWERIPNPVSEKRRVLIPPSRLSLWRSLAHV